jgi:PEGA domain-containing protein
VHRNDARRQRAPAARAALAAVAAALAPAGCVERKMMIRSDPPGAVITLDGERIEQRTPAEVPFDFGGTRGVTLAAPGHKLLESTAEVADPWFTYFPLDVFAEFLWPGTIEDVQEFDFTLEPYAAASTTSKEELRRRLDELKLRAESFRAGGADGPREPPPPPPPEETPAK